MGIMEGMLSGAGEALQNIGLQGVAAAIQRERDARLSEIRMGEEVAREGRATAAAAAERGRIKTEATGIAEQRGGLMASNAGLDDANYRGDEGVGVSVQKGQATPSARDMAFASGKFDSVMTDERAERTAADTKAERATDNERADKELALRQKQEQRLAGIAGQEGKLKTIQINQAVELESWRKKMSDKTLPAAERLEAKEMYQALSGKDADSWEIVKGKNAMGEEVVLGHSNKKTGAYEKFDGTGFVPQGGGAGGAKWDSASGSVMLDGKNLGSAKTEAEARAMIATARSGKPAAPNATPAPSATATPANKPAQVFNEAGYASIDATLAGAERGDAQAKAMMLRLLDEGGLTRQQRARIEKLK